MGNKRKNKRVDCVVPLEAQQNSVFDHTQTVDFSKGGLGFISQHEIPIHEEITVELMLDEESDPVLAVGKVQWSEPIPDSACYRVGMTFKDVSNESRSRLNKHFSEK